MLTGLVRSDRLFRSSLANWARRERVALATGDDLRVIDELIRSIRAGMVRVYEVDAPPKRVDARRFPHAEHVPEPIPLAPMEAIVDTDKSLLITRCPPLFNPRQEPLRISYLLRELAGYPVQLVIRSEAAPEPPVHRRALAPVATVDGPHELEWDGIDDASGKLVKRDSAPFIVELVYDRTYRDEAKTTIPEPDYRVEYADVHFATDREVLLPAVSDPDGATDGLRSGPLQVLAAALEFGADHPARRVVVYGHADTAGGDSHNLELSDRRARSIALYLTGDRDGWAAHTQKHFEIVDFKRVHAWAAEQFGWSTDPGALDNEWTSTARKARNEFRTRCSDTLGIDLEQGVKQNEEDWKAVFGLYDIAVSNHLACAPEDLEALRGSLTFADPAYVGCGESWPVVFGGQDGVAERLNRRAEVVFFEPEEVPETHGGDDPPGDELYGQDRYRLVRLSATASDEALLRITLLGDHGDAMPGAPYSADTRTGPWTGTADANAVATVPRALVDTTFLLQWAAPDDSERRYWSHHMLATDDGETEQGLLRRLANLGFQRFGDPKVAVVLFQRFLGLPTTGELAHVADLINEWHVTGQRPQPNPEEYEWPDDELNMTDHDHDHDHGHDDDDDDGDY